MAILSIFIAVTLPALLLGNEQDTILRVITDLPWADIFEVIGFVLGLLYLWWEYHADSRLWIVSVIMPLISMVVYISNGIYADASIDVYYFIIAIYGYIVWTRDNRKNISNQEESKIKIERGGKSNMPITHIPPLNLLRAVMLFVLLWGGIYCVLKYVTDSTIPIADSFTTSLSIVAMWMLAKKYIEQWIGWIIVDIVNIFLYSYKGIYLYATLNAIYTIIGIIGYFNWRRMMLTTQGTDVDSNPEGNI